jgi:DNA end-binding protein Ku
MEDTDRIGIATFVMRDKEYLVAILSEGGVLRAETLRFHDEIRTPEEIGLPKKPRLDKSLVSKFERAIRKHSARKLSAVELQDDRAEQLRDLAERKRKRGIDVVEMPEHESVADESDDSEGDELGLLEAIRQSLQGHNDETKRNGHLRLNGHARHNGR